MTLGFFARAIVQVLAAHAVVSTVVGLIVLVSWRRAASDSVSSASTTSRRLFRLRMAPAAAAAVLAWGGIPIAFALWEPAGKIERVGPVALTLAVAGAALIASSLWRLAMALRETQRIHRSLVDADARVVAGLAASSVRHRLALPHRRAGGPVRIAAVRGAHGGGRLRCRRAARGRRARAGARRRPRQPEAPADGRRSRRSGVAAGGCRHDARMGGNGGAGRGRNRRQPLLRPAASGLGAGEGGAPRHHTARRSPRQHAVSG